MSDKRRVECRKKDDNWYEATVYSVDGKLLSREYSSTKQGAINEALESALLSKAERKEN